MLKSRIGIWILVILFCVGGAHVFENLPKWTETIEINIHSEISDTNIEENILDNQYGKYKIKNNNNFDIIISMSDENKDNYSLKDNMLYTPMVMYVNCSADQYEDGFIKAQGINKRKKIDLYTVLTAMEKNQTWQEIGIHEKVAQGQISLCIPDTRTWYYSHVEELFYFILNENKIPTDKEREMLKQRIAQIINKCEKTVDLQKAINDEYINPTKGKSKVFIGPEFLFLTSNGMNAAMGSNRFIPIYFPKTTIIYANFYVKNNYENDYESNTNITEDFITTIQNKSEFMEDIGWRINGSTFDLHNVSERFVKVLK